MTGPKEKRRAMQIDHHGRTVYGDVYLPREKRFPVVIISHGFNGYQDDFKREAELLSENGIGAVTFTFCGSGAHDPGGSPTTDMTLFTEKEDLLAVMDRVREIEGFDGSLFLFGGSQGGMVSAMAAEERPNDLKGLVLLYPALSIPDDWNLRKFPMAQYPTPESIPETIDLWGVRLGRNFVLSLRGFDIYRNMANFTRPVLLMHGACDALIPLSYIRRAAETYPNAELIVYPGAEHGFTPMSVPGAASRLLAFIKDNQ